MDNLYTKVCHGFTMRLDDDNWTARSCDLTPLYIFLWEAVKDVCYANNSKIIHTLKYNIVRIISEIERETVVIKAKLLKTLFYINIYDA